MAIKTRSQLKSYFVKNAIPTEGNFADLFDAQLNQEEDGVFKRPGEPLSVVAAADERKSVLRLYDDKDNPPQWLISLNPKDPTTGTNRAGFGIVDDGPTGETRLLIDAQGLWVDGDLHVGGNLTCSATALKQHVDGNGGSADSFHKLALGNGGAWNVDYNRLFLLRNDGTYTNEIRVKVADDSTALKQHYNPGPAGNDPEHHKLVLGNGTSAWDVDYNRLFLLRPGAAGGYTNEIHVKYAEEVTSSRAIKADITPIAADACAHFLEEIMATELVHYRLRQPADPRDDVVHLGIIAEEAPAEIVNKSRTALEIGDYCAFLLGGIKALKAEIEALRRTLSDIRESDGIDGRHFRSDPQ